MEQSSSNDSKLPYNEFATIISRLQGELVAHQLMIELMLDVIFAMDFSNTLTEQLNIVIKDRLISNGKNNVKSTTANSAYIETLLRFAAAHRGK